MSLSSYPIHTLLPTDPLFPSSLFSVKPTVKQLYYRGTWRPDIFDQSLAIVGSRRFTRYGHQAVDLFLPDIISRHITTISGFMYGIETLIHQSTIDLAGTTVAILGNGLDILYPVENGPLYSNILDSGGLIISEYPPDLKPALYTFPQRNRLVAALASLGVLIIEASLKSGSLITAQAAAKLHRPIYAVPGPITSSVSTGTNQLIKDGLAQMATSPADLFCPTPPTSPSIQPPLFPDFPSQQTKIYHLLSAEPLTLDEIALKLASPVAELSVHLSSLALKDLIEETDGTYYPKTPKPPR